MDSVGKERAIDGWSDLRPLGAKLFIAEDGRVAQHLEDLAECGTVFQLGLRLDADLVAGWVAVGRGTGLALVGDGPEAAIAADAENLPGFAEGPAGRVVEGVLLEGSGRIEQEAEAGEKRLEAAEIANGEFEFDLGALHAKSIRRRG